MEKLVRSRLIFFFSVMDCFTLSFQNYFFHSLFLRKVIFKYIDETLSLKTYPEVLTRIALHDKFKVLS